MPGPLNILFLCTHNSARSILAEAMMNHLGAPRVRAYSAGSSPREHQRPNPLALQALQSAGVSTEGLHSKSWDTFAAPGAPVMDLVITVCDSAAAEVCPVWPGHPATAHWGYADPSNVAGDETQRSAAFRHTLHQLGRRIELFLNLPQHPFDDGWLQRHARQLAQS